MKSLLVSATELAVELDHPAYDCFYISLALEKNYRLVTTDDRLLRRIREKSSALADRCIALSDVARP